jgi:O-antigen/teichoic acid export membrane protein
MSGNRVARNAAFSMAQVVISAAALFVTYWLMLRALSVEEIGLWSLVVGSAMVARLTELGLGGGVMRFVAGDLAAGRPRQAAQTIGMAGLAATLLVGGMALAVEPLLHSYLLRITPGELHEAVGVLLPAALLGIVLSTAGGVVLAAIDGCQRMDVRSYLGIGSSLVQLGMTWFVLPRWGLPGLGLVQVVQAGMLLAAGLVVMAWLLRRPLRDYLGFERARFREMIFYGGGLQVVAIAQMLFEPALKVLLTAYSGLTLTGYFDMANRIVLQFRSLIVAGYNALVPHVAALSGSGQLEPKQLRSIYRESCTVLLYVILPYFACVAAGLPLALTLWKGEFDRVFLAVALLQCAAWLLNLLSLPSYLLNVGIGELRWNIVGHVTMSLASLVLGSLLGSQLGGVAVLGAGAAALVVGSLLVPWAFHRRHGLGWQDSIPVRSAPAMMLVLAAFAGAAMLALRPDVPGWGMLAGLPALALAAALAITWRDPLRVQLIARLPRLGGSARGDQGD